MSSAPRYTIISTDCHAGASIQGYREYLPARWHEEFDAWAAAYESPWDDLVNDTASRNWDSELRRDQMEADGVAAELIFPNTIPPFFPSIVNIVPLPSEPAELERRWAGVQAHNRWLVDFCNELPDQRRGMVQVFPHDLDAAIAEVRWAAETGVAGGILIPAIAPNHPVALPLYHGFYDPLWAAIEEAGLAVGTHSGSGEPEYPEDPAASAVMLYEFGLFTNRTLSHLMIGGVFERFPKLRYTMTEQGVRWIVDTIDNLERQFHAVADRPWLELFVKEAYSRFTMTPWEYFQRNCFVGASIIRPGEVASAERIGADNVMWGSDYPHREATAPHSVEALRVALEGLPESTNRKLLAETAATVYGFDLAKLAPVAARVGPTVEQLATPLAAEDFPTDVEWFLPQMQTLAR